MTNEAEGKWRIAICAIELSLSPELLYLNKRIVEKLAHDHIISVIMHTQKKGCMVTVVLAFANI